MSDEYRRRQPTISEAEDDRPTMPPEPTPTWVHDLVIQLDTIHTAMGKLTHAVGALTDKVTDLQGELRSELGDLKRRVAKIESRVDELEHPESNGAG